MVPSALGLAEIVAVVGRARPPFGARSTQSTLKRAFVWIFLSPTMPSTPTASAISALSSVPATGIVSLQSIAHGRIQTPERKKAATGAPRRNAEGYDENHHRHHTHHRRPRVFVEAVAAPEAATPVALLQSLHISEPSFDSQSDDEECWQVLTAAKLNLKDDAERKQTQERQDTPETAVLSVSTLDPPSPSPNATHTTSLPYSPSLSKSLVRGLFEEPSPKSPKSHHKKLTVVPSSVLVARSLALDDDNENASQLTDCTWLIQARKSSGDATRRAHAYYQHAQALEQQRCTDGALDAYQTAHNLYAPNSLGRAKCLLAQGHLAGREDYLIEALDLRQRQLGTWHVDTLEALHELGLLYLQKGQYQSAHECLSQVLTLFSASFGPRHVRVSAVARELAACCFHRQQYAAALDHIDLALDIDRQSCDNMLVNELQDERELYQRARLGELRGDVGSTYSF